jgi:RNA polymerase primary sigma factor
MRQMRITPKITERESLSLDKYLKDIGKIELLTSEQEVELINRYKKGDTEAFNKLTRANLRFVISVAKQYQNQGMPLGDLINEGNLGLIKAARRFDETKGFKFISYAVWWIRQSIMQAIMEDSRMIRIPNNKSCIKNKMKQAIQSFLQSFEREPSCEELADMLNMKEKEVDLLLASTHKHISMDEPLGGEYADDSVTLHDHMYCHEDDLPETELSKDDNRRLLYNAIKRLDNREQEILKAYYGLGGHSPMNLEEVGELCGLTRERVRQIKENALIRLRSKTNKQVLMACLS